MKHVSIKEFFNGVKLNQLTREFDSIDTGYEGKAIYLSHTSFTQVDIARGRRNNVSSVVQLQTKLIECSSVFFEKSRRGSVTLYIDARAATSHGFGARQQVLLSYKDIKGRKESIELFRSWNREDFKGDLIGYGRGKFQYKRDVSNGVKWRYERLVKSRLEDMLYHEMHDLERGRIDENLKDTFAKFGITLTSARPFTFKQYVSFGTKYIKSDGLNFEIGVEHTSTYCSLPEIFQVVVKSKPMKFIPLASLNVEKSGYYDHSESLSIKPEHLKQVKSFKSKFNRNCKGVK